MTRQASIPYTHHYGIFLVTLAVFTLLDALLTVVGLSVGARELNSVVTQWGVHSWILFRVLFLGCLIAVFITGFYLCQQYSPIGLRILVTVLFLLNAFIGAVVVSGIFTIYAQITF